MPGRGINFLLLLLFLGSGFALGHDNVSPATDCPGNFRKFLSDHAGPVDASCALVLDPGRHLGNDALDHPKLKVLDLIETSEIDKALAMGKPGIVVLPLTVSDQAADPTSPLGRFLRAHDQDVSIIFYGERPDVLTEAQLGLVLRSHEIVYGKGAERDAALKKAIERQQAIRTERVSQLERIKKFLADNGIVSYSPQSLRVYRDVEAIAVAGTGTVHITGESGTGKEHTALLMHQLGPNKLGPFVARSIADIPPSLIESELFGHVKGAFTGATDNRDGLFKRADGGTLFLDEIAELPKELQAKLLRVVQEGEFTPVGGTKPIKVKVRLVTGTKENLPKMVAEGKFREDLFYRLTNWHVGLPAFRDRPEDIAPLFQFLVRRLQHSGIGPGHPVKVNALVHQLLTVLPLPGNARELENIARAALLAAKSEGADEIQIRHLPTDQLVQGLEALRKLPHPPEVQYLDAVDKVAVANGQSPEKPSTLDTMDQQISEEEKRRIVEALEQTKTSRGWNRVRAAAALGWPQPKLREAMQRLGINGG